MAQNERHEGRAQRMSTIPMVPQHLDERRCLKVLLLAMTTQWERARTTLTMPLLLVSIICVSWIAADDWHYPQCILTKVNETSSTPIRHCGVCSGTRIPTQHLRGATRINTSKPTFAYVKTRWWPQTLTFVKETCQGRSEPYLFIGILLANGH